MEKTIEVLNALVERHIIERYAIGGAMAAMFYAEPVLTCDSDYLTRLLTRYGLHERWNQWKS